MSRLFDTPTAITGTRRENDTPRALAVTVNCCLLGGDIADPFSDASAPTTQRVYTLLIPRAGWPDHLPPQTGDTVRADGHPVMKITTVTPFANREWVCDCRSTGARQ